MRETVDVIVIGGGIIGMSAALQIAQRSSLRVLVAEKGSGPGEGSTGSSSAVCRFRYTRPETVQLAKDGIAAYRNWGEFLGCHSPLARYQQIGVLWLSNDRQQAKQDADRLASLGVSVDAIDDAEVSSRFPSISTCGIPPDLVNGSPHACTDGGNLHLLEHAGGYMDPSDALQDLIDAARSLQVDLQFKTEVADIEIVGGVVRGVRFKDGSRVACETVILSAGPWSTLLLDRVGLGGLWPLEPTRIQIAHIDRPPSVSGDLPVCVDMAGGIYFRPQNRGQQIVIGSIREEDELEAVSDADDFARYADDEFIREKLHALSHRLGFPDLKGPVRGYSGLYTMNRKDMHPVVGPTPIDGLMVASGFSGHGFKLAPAIGSLLARAITESASHFDTTVDESFLSFAREPIKLPSLNVLA